MGAFIGDGVLVEVWAAEKEVVICVYGSEGRLSAEVRVEDTETVWPVIQSILSGEGLEEI